MLNQISKRIPHKLINYGKHLPEGFLANIRYGFPAKGLKVIGVTGTDGKTTTVNMIYEMLRANGFKTSMVSTINAVIGGKSFDTGLHVTSPSSWDLQKLISQAKINKDEFLILEVTSHALEQFRTFGIKFDIGVITNITHDHLDYHKSFQNYVKAKCKLIKNTPYVVLNKSDENYPVLKNIASGKILTFGLNSDADINPKSFPLKLKLLGDFNILNAEAAVCVGKILSIDEKIIRNSLQNFSGLHGRLEEIKNDIGIRIFVDFAHTPNAIKNALIALRSIKRGKLIGLFGAPGERDETKRSAMGENCAKNADITIITDDDPRFADRRKIVEEIALGAYKIGVKDGINLFKEPNRVKAIQLAVSLAKKGDVIALLGKGHEKSISFKGKECIWSDIDVVKLALSGNPDIIRFDYTNGRED